MRQLRVTSYLIFTKHWKLVACRHVAWEEQYDIQHFWMNFHLTVFRPNFAVRLRWFYHISDLLYSTFNHIAVDVSIQADQKQSEWTSRADMCPTLYLRTYILLCIEAAEINLLPFNASKTLFAETFFLHSPGLYGWPILAKYRLY